MTKFRRYWSVVALALVFLAGAVMHELAPMPVQAAGSAPVTIQNTPLPVSLQGTGTIAGTVNAAQSGAWSVGISNFPATQAVSGTVNVGNFPATQNVKVTNAAPLGTTAADNPAFQPVQMQDDRNFDGSGFCQGTLAVPGSGERLVIENIAVRIAAPTGVHLFDLYIQTNAGSVVNHELAPTFQDDNGITRIFLVSEATRLYADPGTYMPWVVQVQGATSSGYGCTLSLSGHLVNLP